MTYSSSSLALGIQYKFRHYGVVVGTVTNNQDPLQLGRVKVKIPALFEANNESNWAPVMMPTASGQQGGKAYGFYALPEIDDRVLVAFEQGLVDRPFVLGSFWGFGNKPPEKNENEHNDIRLIRSRSGHQITLDDTQGEEKITVSDQSGRNKIVIDVSNNKMTLIAEQEIEIQAKQKIAFNSGGDFLIECAGQFELKAGGNSKMSADANHIQLQASPADLNLSKTGATLKYSGAEVSLNTLKVSINQGALEVM
ncbi:phage tail protein [Cyanobacteria bacterium FACHB-63]|nr:phage tail protein [Cyanobacteria bacterium FACHB-63]